MLASRAHVTQPCRRMEVVRALWMNEIYTWRLKIFTQNDTCSQRHLPPQAIWRRIMTIQLTKTPPKGTFSLYHVAYLSTYWAGGKLMQVHFYRTMRKCVHFHVPTHTGSPSNTNSTDTNNIVTEVSVTLKKWVLREVWKDSMESFSWPDTSR